MSKTFEECCDDCTRAFTCNDVYTPICREAWNAAQQNMLEEIKKMLEGIIETADEQCPDDEYSRAASKIGVAMVESIIEYLKETYGGKDE